MEQIEEQGAIVFRLTKEEVLELCKPGTGPDTCIWLLAGPNGFDCHYFARPTALCRRWIDGQTVAKRNGCELVKSKRLSMKQVEADTLADIINQKRV